MVKRLLWILVGAVLMFVGIITASIALGQESAVPSETPILPTVTETPTPSPTAEIVEVIQPTIEPPVQVVQPTVEVPAQMPFEEIPPTLGVVEQTAEPLPPTSDPSLLPSATLDPAVLPTMTLDPALQPAATTDPAILPSATLDPMILPSATLDPALPTATRDAVIVVPLTPLPANAMPMPPTQPGLVTTVEATPMDFATPLAPTETSLAPIDVVQTVAASTATVIAQPTVSTETGVVQPTEEILLTPIVEATALPAIGQVSGVITFQNLQSHAGIRLTLLLPDGTNANAMSDDQGRFAFANLLPGSYALEASAHGFLSTRVEFTLTDGQQFALPDGLLKAGDTNEDNLIDLQDVALIAANFNGPAHVIETDLNGDGWVDVSDLSLAGALFGTSGPLPWG